jgi:hypothetical protein
MSVDETTPIHRARTEARLRHEASTGLCEVRMVPPATNGGRAHSWEVSGEDAAIDLAKVIAHGYPTAWVYVSEAGRRSLLVLRLGPSEEE